MTIYIEEFILQNIIINYCLLRLVYLTVKPNSSFFRLLISSLIGAASSVISAIFITNIFAMNILKFITAFIMVITAFKQRKRQLIYSYILLFLYTFALAGGINMFSSTNIQTSFGIISFSKINFNIIVLFIILLTYIFELISKSFNFRIKTNNYIYKATLIHKGKKININAYMDTGNLLSLDGKPIIILDLNTYLTLTNRSIIDFYLSKENTIITTTINGQNNLKLFTIDEIKIKVKHKFITYKNQLIAINANNSFNNTNFQALLSPMLI